MLRDATKKDMGNMIRWCRKLHDFSNQRIPFCEKSMTSFINHLLVKDDSLVIVNDFGMLIGAISPSFWNFDHKIAAELFIWQDTDDENYKADGYEMLKYFDKWAIINHVSESGLTQQNVGKDLQPIFSRMGYKMKEITYSKEHI